MGNAAMIDVSLTHEIDNYLKRLFPICRSITGEGNRETLRILQEIVPLQVKEVPSGTDVYDWTIPQEWNIRDAWIEDEAGRRLIDFSDSNLHVVSYSEPVDAWLDWDELQSHLHYREDLPEAIPYRTTYYNLGWSFCVNGEQYEMLRASKGKLHARIDSSFSDGSLSYGELLISGRLKKEILLSCYICHPSMANDSLSGVLLTAFLANHLLAMQEELNYSYRIVFVPETIGAIAYCATHEADMRKIESGFVVTTVGGPGKLGYKQSFDASHPINRIIEQVFQEKNIDRVIYPFDIHGSDERQYSSQGFRINVASISKDKYYEYPFYHTSLDNLDFVRSEAIVETLEIYEKVISKLDKNIIYRNKMPNCEVMLSKHDLYPKTGGSFLPSGLEAALDARLWLLFLCDGGVSLLEIAEQTGLSIDTLYDSACEMENKGILERG